MESSLSQIEFSHTSDGEAAVSDPATESTEKSDGADKEPISATSIKTNGNCPAISEAHISNLGPIHTKPYTAKDEEATRKKRIAPSSSTLIGTNWKTVILEQDTCSSVDGIALSERIEVNVVENKHTSHSRVQERHTFEEGKPDSCNAATGLYQTEFKRTDSRDAIVSEQSAGNKENNNHGIQNVQAVSLNSENRPVTVTHCDPTVSVLLLEPVRTHGSNPSPVPSDAREDSGETQKFSVTHDEQAGCSLADHECCKAIGITHAIRYPEGQNSRFNLPANEDSECTGRPVDHDKNQSNTDQGCDSADFQEPSVCAKTGEEYAPPLSNKLDKQMGKQIPKIIQMVDDALFIDEYRSNDENTCADEEIHKDR